MKASKGRQKKDQKERLTHKEIALGILTMALVVIFMNLPLPDSQAASGSVLFGGKVTIVFPPNPVTCPAIAPVMIVKNVARNGIPIIGVYPTPASKIYAHKVLDKPGENLLGTYFPDPIYCNGFITFTLDRVGTSK